MAAEYLAIGANDNPVGSLLLNADAVVGEAVGRVKVEDPEQAGALKYNDLVALVLEADVGLWRVQPAILFLGPLHLAVKLVEELVAEEVVVCEVELAAGIVEAVAVAFTGKVEPLWVAKLIALKVQVAFASKTVRDQADHLVQRQTPVYDGSQLRERRHVGVHLRIAEPEEQCLVTDEPV